MYNIEKWKSSENVRFFIHTKNEITNVIHQIVVWVDKKCD